MAHPADWPGHEIADAHGMRYGRLDDVFVGRASGRPEFGIVTVARQGGEGTKQVAVPLHHASLEGGVVRLPLDPARVKAAPEVQGEVDHIPPDAGGRVLAYFGLHDEETTAVMPHAQPGAGHDLTAQDPDASLGAPIPDTAAEAILNEEQLKLGKEMRPAERVRLRKQVVTEEVTLKVALRREELVIEREPIPADAVGLAPSGALGEGEDIVVVLHAEEPVIERRVVPVERVRLRRDTVTEDAVIREPIRRERVDVEHIDIEEQPNP